MIRTGRVLLVDNRNAVLELPTLQGQVGNTLEGVFVDDLSTSYNNVGLSA